MEFHQAVCKISHSQTLVTHARTDEWPENISPALF